jgi:hypothetical protein
MSEGLWVVVGGIIAALSGISATLISSWITCKEARKGRLIETRKGALLPLREKLSNFYSYCLNMRFNLQLLEIGKEKGIPTGHVMREMSYDRGGPLTTLKEQISPLIEQIADRTLIDLS